MPKHYLLSLPPILCIIYRNSISSCSKALRGLSVQSRVICIFTYTTISPRSLLRQRPNYYTIRAGRNLPDKEFRYLRTVIVTAAVHWGLSSMLRLASNISPWPSSTGQASAPIRHLTISQRPVFLVNSYLGLFSVTNSRWHPFSRSYGVILQSSLTMLLSSVLGFSPRPPVSVCGTGFIQLFSNFSRQREFINFVTIFTPRHGPA